MGTCVHRSATVIAAPISQSVIECTFGGLVTQAAMTPVHRASIEAMECGLAGVARMDVAVFTLGQMPVIPRDLYRRINVPVAVVAQPHDYDFWREWALLLAREVGLVRAVFLSKNLELARRWAEEHASATRQEFRSLPPSRPRLYLVGR